MSELDGREAALKVREFFHDTHGPLGVLMFEVEKAIHSGGAWLIRCSFYPSFLARSKVYYDVVVDAESGRILEVKQLEGVVKNE